MNKELANTPNMMFPAPTKTTLKSSAPWRWCVLDQRGAVSTRCPSIMRSKETALGGMGGMVPVVDRRAPNSAIWPRRVTHLSIRIRRDGSMEGRLESIPDPRLSEPRRSEGLRLPGGAMSNIH